MGPRRELPRRRAWLRSLVTLSALVGLALISTAADGVSAAPPTIGAPFQFNFEGNPPAPQPWNPSNWDVVVNSRNTNTFVQLEGMQAQHGADCSPYPATHFNNTYEGAVFLCHDHVMTAINAGGYGQIVLTPDHMIDFSGGETTIRFSLSTLRTSYRDWVDIWITPFDDNLTLPLNLLTVDNQGPPARAIQLKMDQVRGTIFRAYVIDNFRSTQLPSREGKSLENLVGKPSAVNRTTLELTISPSHLRFGAPGLGYNWVDTPLTGVRWTRGIVQLAHHSYNPTKDCKNQGLPACLPNTWHWSNFSISNALPFTLLRGNPQVVSAGTPGLVKFSSPAPKSAFLRFAAIGSIDVSLDGKTWQAAQRQAQKYHAAEHFSSYWTPIPAGTKTVSIRGHNWFAGPWWVRDFSIWSTTIPPTSSSGSTLPKPPAGPAAGGNSKPTLLQMVLAAARKPSGITAVVAVIMAAVLGGIAYFIMVRRRRARLRSK